MAKRFITPFAEAGDRAEISNEPIGSDVNMQTGYPAEYEADPISDPNARFVERDKTNQLFNDITANIKEWQENTYPAFITAANNGGTAFSYKKGDRVSYNGDNYESLEDNNQDIPASPRWVDVRSLIIPTFKSIFEALGYNFNGVPEFTRISWQGYYAQSDGGSNWGVLRFGNHTEDGAYIFSIDANTYIEANIKCKRFNIRKAGAKEPSFDNKLVFNAIASLNLNIYVPKGDFGTSGRHTFSRSMVGDGSGASRIYNLDTSSNSDLWLIAFSGIPDGGEIKGVTIDGMCSSLQNTQNIDPDAWSASNYNTWFGTKALIVANSSRVKLSDVVGCNSGKGAAIRIEKCTHLYLRGVRANRCRGEFGDGFYQFDSQNIRYVSCESYDFTRIGFVSEGKSLNSQISDKVTYTDCAAEYGHDQGIDYGGGEYNAGFWAENTDDVAYLNCHSVNTYWNGFINSASQHADGNSAARVSYDYCTASSVIYGFKTGTIGGFQTVVEASYFMCRADVKVSAFLTNVRETGFMNVSYRKCSYKVSDDVISSNSFGFGLDVIAGGILNVEIDRCTGDWSDDSKLKDTSANTADVSQFNNSSKSVYVTGSDSKIGVFYIKNRQSSNIDLHLSDMISETVIAGSSSGNIDTNIINSKVSGSVYGAITTFSNAEVTSGKALVLNNGECYGNVKLLDSILWINQAEGYSNDKSIKADINVDMARDVANSDFGLRIQCEQVVKPTFIISGSFLNTSGVSTSQSLNFINAVRAGTTLITRSAIKDDTVPRLYRIANATNNFTINQQDISMH